MDRSASPQRAARAYLEKLLWPEDPVCPNCGLVNEAYKLRARFMVKMGAIFEDSQIPLHKRCSRSALCAHRKEACARINAVEAGQQTAQTAVRSRHREITKQRLGREMPRQRAGKPAAKKKARTKRAK